MYMEHKTRSSKYEKQAHSFNDIERKKEAEIERKREELRKIVFNKNMDEDFIKVRNKEKPTGTYVILSLLFTIVLAFCLMLIYISSEKTNELYYIINAIFILVITISYLVSFKYAYMYKNAYKTIINAFLIFIFLLFNTLYILGVFNLPAQKTIPNFYNVSYTKVLKWANDNKIKTKVNYEYSDIVKKNNVISQSKKEGKFIKNTSNISYVVSMGENPYKEVTISNMTGKNIDKTIKMIKKKKLNNVTINYTENKDIEKNTIISQSVSGNIKRNTEIIFTVSLGNIDDLKDIKIKDLYNKNYLDACVYLKQNGINYKTVYEFSNNIKKGYVISVSDYDKQITRNDTVSLTISKGKGIIVPDFTSKKEEEILKTCSKLNIKCLFVYTNDENNKKGTALKQSIEKGTIISEDETITINIGI